MGDDRKGGAGLGAGALAAIAFVAATMVANVMSLRMVAPLGIVADAGVLLYPVTFVLRDAIHRRAGLAAANTTIVMSCVCNAAMFALFALVAWLPADPMTGPQEQFGAVLMPGFLIVAGSIAGQFVSEMVDGRIFHRMGGADPHATRGRFVRAVLVSNLVSIPLDTLIMCGIAFGFTVPFASLISTIVANILVKLVVMGISLACVTAARR